MFPSLASRAVRRLTNCAGGEGKGGGTPGIAAGLKPRPSGAPDQPPCVGEKSGLKLTYGAARQRSAGGGFQVGRDQIALVCLGGPLRLCPSAVGAKNQQAAGLLPRATLYPQLRDALVGYNGLMKLGLEQSRWVRSEPRNALPAFLLERIMRTAFSSYTVTEIQPFSDGLRNANFKLRVDSASEPLVLRLYEHDASLCQKELDLMRLVAKSVPVPEVIHAEPRGLDDCPPFMLMRYVEGITFRELKRGRDCDAIGQAAFSAGETLAAINRNIFTKPGWLAPGPAVTAPLLEGPHPLPRFIDSSLSPSNLRLRMPADLRDRTHAMVWAWAPKLAGLEGETRLVHGDFNKRNLIVRRRAGRWSVAAVLDWEFAISGSPLNDIGNFLRYEPASRPLFEPHFSSGYLHAGGNLPDGWRRLARLVDLTALCESLTRGQLPDTIIAELIELLRATVENRDPP